jgi:hypothetical protein
VYGGGAVVVVAVLGLIGIGVLRYAPPAKMPAPHDIADEANVVQTSKPPIADEGGGRRGSGKSKPSEDRTVAKKLAFLVGVKTYDHLDLKPLEFPENDVEEAGKVFEACGFETVILTNARGKKARASRPTADNIREGLKSLLRSVTRQDMIVVGLAGHGLQPRGSSDSFFCPTDANPVLTKDGNPIAPERLVSVGELLAEMSNSGIGHKLLLVDACRNDPSVRGMRHRGVDRVDVGSLPPQTGMLLSCSPGEFSFETKALGTGHGVFFHHIIEGLKGGARDSKGRVTWNGLVDYAQDSVPDSVQRLFGKEGGEQNPNSIGNLQGASAVLSVVRIESPKVEMSRTEPIGSQPARRTPDESPSKTAPDSKAGAHTPASSKRFTAQRDSHGNWSIVDDHLEQTSLEPNAYLFFGDPAWKDYDFVVDVMQGNGKCQVCQMFRIRRAEGAYYYGLATDGHSQCTAEYQSWAPATRNRQGTSDRRSQKKREINQRQWYTMLVRVRGTHAQCFLNGTKMFDFDCDEIPSGCVGLRTWTTEYRFRNIKVTAPDGTVLLEGLPDLN